MTAVITSNLGSQPNKGNTQPESSCQLAVAYGPRRLVTDAPLLIS